VSETVLKGTINARSFFVTSSRILPLVDDVTKIQFGKELSLSEGI